MTNRINISCLTTLGLLLAASPSLVSQVTTGSVVGRVTDGNGNPIAGARVILTAPQLMGQREITADANGEWRASLLPVGDYTIRFSASGYIGSTISNIRVGIGSAIRQDRVLRPVGVATETVDIVGTDNTVVDKTDTRTAVNYSSAAMQQLTGAFNLQSVRDFSAGSVRMSGQQSSVRGGAITGNTYRLNGIEIREGEYGEGYQMDFMVNDLIEDIAIVLSPTNARYGRAASAVEIATRSGGNQFSGTFRYDNSRNIWGSGSANRNASYRDPFTSLLNNTNQVNDNIGNTTLSFTLTGPVIKDRLWFALAARRTNRANTRNFWNYSNDNQNFRTIRAVTTGNDNESFTQANYIWHPEIDALTNLIVGTHPITNRPYPTLDRSTAWGGLANYDFPAWEYGLPFDNIGQDRFYSAKLTWQITQSHRLAFEGHSRHDTDSADQSNNWRRREQMSESDMNNWSWRLDYNAILSPSTLLEFKAGRMKIPNVWAYGDQSQLPNASVNLNYDRNNYLHANGHPIPSLTSVGILFAANFGPGNRNNASGSLNLTMHRNFWDMNHHIDTGIDYWKVDLGGNSSAYSVQIGGFFENPNATGEQKWLIPVLKYMGIRQFGQSTNGQQGLAPYRVTNVGTPGTYETNSTAFYVNDQMTINDKWNIMLGLRYEKYDGQDIEGKTILSSNSLNPRFTLTYDPKGDSSHVFKLSYVQTTEEFRSGLLYDTARTSPGSATTRNWWTGADLPGGPQPNPMTLGDIDPVYGQEMYGLRFIPLSELAKLSNYNMGEEFTDAGQSAWGMEDLKPQSNTMITLEYRRNYGRGSYFRTSYTYRWFSDLLARKINYDLSHFWARRDPRLDVRDTQEEATPIMARRTYYFNDGSLWRDYHGFELETVTRINSVFTMNLNYTYSQARGNSQANEASSGDAGGNGALRVVTNRYIESLFHERRGTPMSELDPDGAVDTDRPHIVNLGLTATVPIVRGGYVAYVLRGNYTSGRNYSLTNNVPMTAEERAHFAAVQNEAIAASLNPGYVSPTHGQFNPLGAKYIIGTWGAPPTTWSRYYSARGAYHAGDSWSLNFTINWEVPIYKKVRTMGTLNISGVLNAPHYDDYRRTSGNDNGLGQHVSDLNGSFNYELRGQRYGNNYNFGTVPISVNNKTGYRSASLSMGLKF